MAPIFSDNTKYLKSRVQNGIGIFVTEQHLQWKPHLNNAAELKVIKEIQIYRHMTMYDQS